MNFNFKTMAGQYYRIYKKRENRSKGDTVIFQNIKDNNQQMWKQPINIKTTTPITVPPQRPLKLL